MKMVPVYNANGDKILACACDLEHYQGIGWATEEPAKAETTAKAETKAGVETQDEVETQNEVEAEAIVEPTKEAE